MKQRHYRIDWDTRIRPLQRWDGWCQRRVKGMEGCYSRGAAAGYPVGEWPRELLGTDCNDDDEVPVVLILASGHCINEHGSIRDGDVVNVRRIYVSMDYASDELEQLILSAMERAGMALADDPDPVSALRRQIQRMHVTA